MDALSSGDAAGDPIYIRTHDDIAVTGVRVSIADGASVGLEDGQAVADAFGGRWVYTAQTAIETGTAVRITVTASDRPGGEVSAQADKTV